MLVVAHSQGNLFAHDAYEKIVSDNKSSWMGKYMRFVSIASPMHFKIAPGTTEISWDNDLVADLGLDLMQGRTKCPVRKVNWTFMENTENSSYDKSPPSSNYTYVNNLNNLYHHTWMATENLSDKFDSNVHAFSFYMGEPLKDANSGKLIFDAFGGGLLKTNIAKNIIMSTVKVELQILEDLKSQWKTDKEFDKDTCNYRVTLNHRFDSSMFLKEKVYPFDLDKKLYAVNGEYVKAKCGGEKIKNLQKENLNGCDEDTDCYLLEGTNEKITKKPSKWEVIDGENNGTCEWRVTVENNVTHEKIAHVYPFNLDGHVYKVGNGDVVIASCGGETILDDWEGKRLYNCYLLEGTGEKINIDKNITITGSITTAECKMTHKDLKQTLGFWAEGCPYTSVEALHKYVYSRDNTYHQLPPCQEPKYPLPKPFDPRPGEYFSQKVPEGYVLAEENVTKVIKGTYPAYDGHDVVYINVRRPTDGDYSVFCHGLVAGYAWSVDEYSGVLTKKIIKRTYVPAEE